MDRGRGGQNKKVTNFQRTFTCFAPDLVAKSYTVNQPQPTMSSFEQPQPGLGQPALSQPPPTPSCFRIPPSLPGRSYARSREAPASHSASRSPLANTGRWFYRSKPQTGATVAYLVRTQRKESSSKPSNQSINHILIKYQTCFAMKNEFTCQFY